MSGNTFTKYTKYTVKELESYVSDPNACVQKLERTDYISVLPKHLGNIAEGVRTCLSQKIGTYDRRVDGVILAFKNTKVLSPLAAIRPNSSRLHVKIRADFYVFRPTNGSVIGGTVKYVSSNFLSAVIYRVFNVTIKLPSQKIQNISRGSDIRFIIKSFDMKSDLPYIEGQLIMNTHDKLSNGSIKKEKISNGDTPLNGCTPHVAQIIKPDVSQNTASILFSPEVKVKQEPKDDSESKNISQPSLVEEIRKPKKKKRKNKEVNGLLSDDEIDSSISAILKNFEQDIISSNETDASADVKPITNSSEPDPPASAQPPKKKKKKKEKETEMDELEAAILRKLAAELGESSSANPIDESNASDAKKAKKRKKKSKPSTDSGEDDDFEASIMSSILKCAAEAEGKSDSQPTRQKTTDKVKRKSVRFDDTIREVSFNTFDTSDLLDISQLAPPTLSSTLNHSI
ncbi:FACT complex subunit SSRP1-A [Toxorhynchites rutilus septentrionalis]|uniref:FACT complex subunit SSRP1-A n=1 Tax=Toxorhynchites rutilus septentrionalis TaxID=329112 RepID=UPI00247A781A|nr:FACT complex subunit SSRP1-A [Toxorhynchites rutilus septentrionalis]